ncbi:Ribonuclease P protein subunit p29 [Sphaceloma murrayae]|uniref:Ribonuclease P protein subunit n=1 Tax=Sphaceloma murrayae TaxID=2082308 RepID=A0A2K1QUV7_9PEZI|nr:Ribonuclease P protein subunit p29 [Sphaceloma murrayae]
MTDPHPALALLSQAHAPTTASDIFTSLKHRPLLLRPSSPDPTSAASARETRRIARRARARAAQVAFKKTRKSGRASLTSKPRPLSAKEKRKLGIYELGPEERKWALYEGLHRLWCGYMREVLGLDREAGRRIVPDFAGPMVASGDFHGAVVKVARCGCVSRVGVSGIVVKDTKHTFEVVTRRDRVVTLPKEGTVFRVEVPRTGDALDEVGDEETRVVLEIHGDMIKTSAPDRATRKFKMHFDPGL